MPSDWCSKWFMYGFSNFCSWVQKCIHPKFPHLCVCDGGGGEGRSRVVPPQFCFEGGVFLTFVSESKTVKIRNSYVFLIFGEGASNFCSRVQNCPDHKFTYTLREKGRWWWLCVDLIPDFYTIQRYLVEYYMVRASRASGEHKQPLKFYYLHFYWVYSGPFDQMLDPLLILVNCKLDKNSMQQLLWYWSVKDHLKSM